MQELKTCTGFSALIFEGKLFILKMKGRLLVSYLICEVKHKNLIASIAFHLILSIWTINLDTDSIFSSIKDQHWDVGFTWI